MKRVIILGLVAAALVHVRNGGRWGRDRRSGWHREFRDEPGRGIAVAPGWRRGGGALVVAPGVPELLPVAEEH
jgi:hypothetical protein